jgi:hypothetical protein
MGRGCCEGRWGFHYYWGLTGEAIAAPIFDHNISLHNGYDKDDDDDDT